MLDIVKMTCVNRLIIALSNSDLDNTFLIDDMISRTSANSVSLLW
jgi:hypothetical protein